MKYGTKYCPYKSSFAKFIGRKINLLSFPRYHFVFILFQNTYSAVQHVYIYASVEFYWKLTV